MVKTYDEDTIPLYDVKAQDSASPTTKIMIIRAACILISEFCERMAYYSIDANLLLLFIENLDLGTADANILVLLWKGCCYVSPLIGGWLADSYLGRFKAILIFIIIYVLSMVSLAVGCIPSLLKDLNWLVFLSLFVIAFATGGIKSNVVTFGADQFNDVKREDVDQLKQAYFNWFYFSINCGSIISYTAIAYVQQQYGFSIGLGIPAGIMALSAIFFFLGTSFYTHTPPAGSVIFKDLQILWACLTASDEVKYSSVSFWDRANHAKAEDGSSKFSRSEVDDFKDFSTALPIQLTFIVPWCCYAQMSSVFFTQGTVLNLQIGSFTLPVTSLHVFNGGAIIILVPLFERVLYPLLRRININFSMLRRIGTGYLFLTLGIFYAGGLEVYRLHLFSQGQTIQQKLGDRTVVAVDLSILVQAPGFVLIGIGEILSSITGLEFAESQAPKSMRSMVIAVFYLTNALGNYLGAALVAIVNLVSTPPWIQNNSNKSRMDLYFFTLTVLALINLYVFIFIAKRYKLKAEREQNRDIIIPTE